MASTVRIASGDLRELRRDLDAVEVGLGREVSKALLSAAEPMLATAVAGAPFDATHRGWKGRDVEDDPGHLRESLHLQPTPYGVALYTTHPGGAVHEYGGTIAPKGHPFTIKRSAFAETAGETHAGRLERRAEDSVDDLLRRHNL